MQNISTYKTPENFRAKSKITVQLWWIVYAMLFRPSPQIMYGWRRFLLRLFGAKVGKKVILRPTTQITYPWKVSIGDYSWIGDDVVLYSLGTIVIGSNSVISQRSYICTGSHDYLSEGFDIYAQNITIGSKCWLATDVYVAPSVQIGDGTVVGARSSVFKDLPANKVCMGTPAKPTKDRIIKD
jgi:putative colanic acid biosynthesis acetyltransferase WcaF